LSLLEQEPRQGYFSQCPGVRSRYIGKLKSDVAPHGIEYTQMSTVYSENYPKLALMRKKIPVPQDRILSGKGVDIGRGKDFAEKEQQASAGIFKPASKEASRVQFSKQIPYARRS